MTQRQRHTQALHVAGATDDVTDERQPPTDEGTFLRIDEVSRRTNLTKRTLRYYEEMGLLSPAQRSEGNYRLYSETDIHMLEHIIAMRDLLGLELKEIREMVNAELTRERIKEQWQTDPAPTWRPDALDEGEAMADHELRLLDEKLEGLAQLRGTLLQRLERYQLLRKEIRAQVGLADETADQ